MDDIRLYSYLFGFLTLFLIHHLYFIMRGKIPFLFISIVLYP